MSEIIYLPVPKNMTLEQVQHWEEQEMYWSIRENDSLKALEYAQRQRENASRMLGKIGMETGLNG